MNKIEKDSLELAEKICQKKFEEHFNVKLGGDKLYMSKSQIDIYKEQIKLWTEVGKTYLTEAEVQLLPPINQALWFKCNQKIKWCTQKIVEL